MTGPVIVAKTESLATWSFSLFVVWSLRMRFPRYGHDLPEVPTSPLFTQRGHTSSRPYAPRQVHWGV
jgi:hypothetical protein